MAVLPTTTPTITPTPTPRPITLAEMNQKYGPCTKVNVLMYHHIQPEDEAKKLKQTGLTVSPEYFKIQMAYLKSEGYTPIFPIELIKFFDDGVYLPKKPVMITLDDAYEDNYLYAYPILKELSTKAIIFTPTGLVTVMDYLNWNEIAEMNQSGLVYFANHTWSHHSSTGSPEVLDKEISLADRQLGEKGLNEDNVFAYPYGKPSNGAEMSLIKYGYKLAFTTNYGNIMCKGKRFELPRIRIGNAPLSRYGL
jgi:peptidoglycan/xylan/chitin deacetylase (PgdA/CDA1 family)